MEPLILMQTPADFALDRALAGSDESAIIGAGAASGPAVTIANFTAGTAATTIAALSFTMPENRTFASIVGSLSCTLASAATMTVTAQQNNGGVASGGTAVGSRFRYTGSAVTVTGGTLQAGLGAVSVYQLAAGNIAAWTFPLNGQIFAAGGTVIVIPVIVAIATSTVAVTNAVLQIAVMIG